MLGHLHDKMNEMKSILNSGKSKGLWDLKVHQDGVKLVDSLEWQSAVSLCETERIMSTCETNWKREDLILLNMIFSIMIETYL
jgi:hypothetical protein